MKKSLIIFLIPMCFAACSGGSTSSSTTSSKDSVTTTSVSLPFTAQYSSDFVPGKPADVATVLNNYKAWQDNDMVALKSTFGDSVTMYFPSGSVFNGTNDSLMKDAKKFRDSIAKVDLTIYAWTSNHSVDKNEDWVNVWYKEVDSYKTGKKDSANYEDDNRLKDGKIVWVSTHQQKYKK
jgi:ketosteroid isomerase-like protein